jgi:hypothetical protein
MDWCRDSFGVGHIEAYARRERQDVVLSAFNIDSDVKSTRKVQGIKATLLDAPAFTNLTSQYCEALNSVTLDDPNVHYASYAAVSKVEALSSLHFSYKIILAREGENDGLVALQSAKWGEFMGIVECDHWELIPPRMRKLVAITQSKFDSVEFYLKVVTDLANKGF